MDGRPDLVEWADLGLRHEARRLEPPPPMRKENTFSDLRSLLSAAAAELKKGAKVAGEGSAA